MKLKSVRYSKKWYRNGLRSLFRLLKITSLCWFQIYILDDKTFNILSSLVGKHFDPVNLHLHVWQNGLGWLQAVCTCPQKAIVGMQKILHRWILCKKSLQKLSSESRKTFSSIVATYIPTVCMHLVEVSIFSLNHVIVRLTKVMNNLLKHLKIRTFKVIFLSFRKKFYKEYLNRRPTFI